MCSNHIVVKSTFSACFLLPVPEKGALAISTEFGRMQVSPGEICVIQVKKRKNGNIFYISLLLPLFYSDVLFLQVFLCSAGISYSFQEWPILFKNSAPYFSLFSFSINCILQDSCTVAESRTASLTVKSTAAIIFTFVKKKQRNVTRLNLFLCQFFKKSGMLFCIYGFLRISF